LWALGAILYELVAGVSPFEGATVSDTLARIVADAPHPVRNHAPDLPERLAALIAMCLEKDPALRPASVGALLEELAATVPEAPLAIDVAPAGPISGVSPTGSTMAARDRAWSSLRTALPPVAKPKRTVWLVGVGGVLVVVMAWTGFRSFKAKGGSTI